MIKNLMKSIFSEEIELEDEELEEVEPEKEIEEPIKEAPVELAPIKKEQPVKEVKKVVQASLQTKPIQEKKKSTFVTLDVDTVSKQDKKPKRKVYHYDRTKMNKPVKPQKNLNYDYQSVVSPIFGNTADDDKQYDKVHNAIELEKPAVLDSFDQVISPMYGSCPKPQKKEYIPKKEVVEEKKEKIEEYTQPEIIALSDILEKKKKKDTSLKQEKLFVSKN